LLLFATSMPMISGGFLWLATNSCYNKNALIQKINFWDRKG
jgi:hypothetical protein